MQSNQSILLDQLLHEKRAQSEEVISETDFFEFFSIEQILKDLDLGNEEIDEGIIDGGADGGIDGFYIFVNDILVAEDTDISTFGKTVRINLTLFQTKASRGFTETAVDKIAHTVGDIFDFSKELADLKSLYRPQLLSKAALFKKVSLELATKLPELTINIHYVTKGTSPSPSQTARANHVERQVTELFPDSNSTFQFVGCSELLSISRRPIADNLSLTFSEGPLPTESGGVVGLVRLRDYYNFLAGKEGRIRSGLFEFNVRDYQGSTEVNAAIKETLLSPDQGEFWWLNNGITIVCARMNSTSKTITLEDPQIVNGLQTSSEIHQYFHTGAGNEDARSVLVRIIKPTDEISRDRIIKATNSQTSIQIASLRATDPFQRDLEQYFLSTGLYYDRRKNFYKNQGKPKARIVSIQTVAQAYIAIVLGQPDNARARPSSLLKDDERYREVFNSNHPLEAYLTAFKIFQLVDTYVKTPSANIASERRINVKYHLAMMVTAVALGTVDVTPDLVATFKIDSIDEALLLDCYKMWYYEFELALHDMGAGEDQIAKSNDFLVRLKRRMANETTRRN